jgi:hypothetical protein
VRNSKQSFGNLLPTAYDTAGVAVDIDFDPTGKFGRYMDRRLKRFVKRYRRRWTPTGTSALERAELEFRPRQDTRPQE